MIKKRYVGDDIIVEHENPPYEIGVEYRTTERIGGKAVYKKRESSGEILYRLDGETAWNKQNGLVGAAPSGYGLGETTYSTAIRVRTLAEVDALVNNGWYQFDGSYEYLNGISNCAIEVIASRYGVTQIQYVNHLTYAGCVARRSRYNTDTWDGCAWEWVNPPMELGVEYRTTERYNGKAVYTRLLNTGALTNGASVNIVEGGNHIVRCVAANGRYTSPFHTPSGLGSEWSFWHDAYNAEFVAYMGSGHSSIEFDVQVWYTKA